MKIDKSLKQKLFRLDSDEFDDLALNLFKYQAVNNHVYNEYIQNIGVNIQNIQTISDIPFLPIEFFKTHEIKSGSWQSSTIFESSGTTNKNVSKHHVLDVDFYLKHSQLLFEEAFGQVSQYHIFALLPSYLERDNSSLIYMIDHLIRQSSSEHSGFFLNNISSLNKRIEQVKESDRKILLIGVSYALLDFIEQYKVDLSGHIVMETGGMKGRRKEITRNELHERLKKGFRVERIYSEYGMTELLSQMYLNENGFFSEPPTMKVLIRDINDPFEILGLNKQGGLNVIDLANYNTCCFIETKDIGKRTIHGIDVLGRFDNSDIRGCNLMI